MAEHADPMDVETANAVKILGVWGQVSSLVGDGDVEVHFSPTSYGFDCCFLADEQGVTVVTDEDHVWIPLESIGAVKRAIAAAERLAAEA